MTLKNPAWVSDGEHRPMIYKSNLEAPDLTSRFRFRNPPMMIMGHDMPSDPEFLPDCGYLTGDEAGILYQISRAWPDKRWVDIGSRFGWTAAHILAGGASDVWMVDPAYRNPVETQLALRQCPFGIPSPYTSKEFFRKAETGPNPVLLEAAMIDGDHDSPEPTLDALRAIAAGCEVLVWHDFKGKPVRDAVGFVLGAPIIPTIDLTGYLHVAPEIWRARVYWTPNGMAVAWRQGCGFVPPDHVPDPAIDWQAVKASYSDFHFERTV